MDKVASALHAAACARPKAVDIGPRPETSEEIADSVVFDLISIVEQRVEDGADRDVALGIVRDVLRMLDGSGGGDSPRLTLRVSDDEESRRLAGFFRGRGEFWPEPGTLVDCDMLGDLERRYAEAGHDVSVDSPG